MIRIGPAGWSYADWQGRVYPRKKPSGFHPLGYLARYVDAIELNSSFYSLPCIEWAERWVDIVREDPEFRFVAKLHQSFTHERLPDGDGELELRARQFLTRLAPLATAGRLAGLLVQFPHSFRCSPGSWRRLDRLRAVLAPVPLVVEVRHKAWFQPTELERFEAGGWSVAALDLPAASYHPPLEFLPTGPVGYLRLHGRNRSAGSIATRGASNATTGSTAPLSSTKPKPGFAVCPAKSTSGDTEPAQKPPLRAECSPGATPPTPYVVVFARARYHHGELTSQVGPTR